MTHLNVTPAYTTDGVPVFTPTMDQFSDFYAFNKAINHYGMQSGIVKVIPPAEWLEQITAQCYTPETLAKVKIKNPILQNINCCTRGVFTVQNIEKYRSFSISQWQSLSRKLSHTPPRSRGFGVIPRTALPKNVDPACENVTHEFPPDRCQSLERNYWRTIPYAEPMYGADVLGSLFTPTTKLWNISSLPNILDLMDEKVPGVNDAYLYAGLWKASFAWHLEDQDLYSINYNHFGAPKQWYLIPQAQHDKFFALMKDTFGDEHRQCSQFLRHKTFLVSPQYLQKHGITCNRIVHYAREFIITYPYGYHAGFNYGYNLAESVNFALDDWFQIGEATSKCECVEDSVGIDVERLKRRYFGERDSKKRECRPDCESPPPPGFDATPKRRKKEEVDGGRVFVSPPLSS